MSLSNHNILGHKAQLADLARDLETGNVSHAYLFEGPAHVGKFSIAKLFAEELLVQGIDPETEERVREEVQKLLHSDVLVIDQLWREKIFEDENLLAMSSNVSQIHRKKAGAKTDTISIDDVRALQERLYDVPRATYRVCLIRNVERLQDEAVNALLKVLEEPPKGLVFILTTSNVEGVLPTLRSRSRRLSFHHLSRAELRPLVAGDDADEAQFLLHLSQGAPGVIVRLRKDPEKLREEHRLSTVARGFWRETSLLTRMQLLAPLHERNEETDRFLLHLALALREMPVDRTSLNAGKSFERLLRALQTNVSRQLLCAELAMASV
jgi:DNA polymerase-3 subunit delta'